MIPSLTGKETRDIVKKFPSRLINAGIAVEAANIVTKGQTISLPLCYSQSSIYLNIVAQHIPSVACNS